MKKTFIFTTILAALVLTSCENFLKAKDVQSQIEESIAYANADQYTIVVDTEKGSGIVTKPAGGEAKVKPSDTFNLAFYAESDHQFVRWEIYDLTINKKIEGNDYLTIENPNLPDTTCTLVKTPENSNIKLGVRAISAERPQIYFTAPAYSQEGVHRNSTIVVRFDHNMDENSIYYTDEEKQQLKEELGITDEDFLIADENRGCVCYGYKKDGTKHFKNIRIIPDSEPTDWENQVLGYSKDIYDYYDVPYFIDVYHRILHIPSKVDAPVGAFRKLTVIINKDCFYSLNDNHITMRESKSWLFALQEYGDKGFEIDGPGRYKNPYIAVNNAETSIVYTTSNVYLNANGQYVTYEEDGINEPPVEQLKKPSGLPGSSIPESSDTEYIRLGFAFTVNDYTGTGIQPEFTITFCNADPDESGETEYVVKVPYQSRRNVELSNDNLMSVGYAGEMSDLYWVEIERGERLKYKKAYSFQLNFANYQGFLSPRDNGYALYYWVKTTSGLDLQTP